VFLIFRLFIRLLFGGLVLTNFVKKEIMEMIIMVMIFIKTNHNLHFKKNNFF